MLVQFELKKKKILTKGLDVVILTITGGGYFYGGGIGGRTCNLFIC